MAEATIQDLFAEHAVLKLYNPLRKQDILRHCEQIVTEDSWHDGLLALHIFASQQPYCYWSREAEAVLSELLNEDSERTWQAMEEFGDEITHAISTHLRPRASLTHESRISLSNLGGIQELDHLLHPEYIRLVEHIFKHLTTFVCRILDLRDGTNKAPKTEPDKAKHLVRCGYASVVDGYNRTVRNSLNHGRVRYQATEIEYHDLLHTETMYPDGFTSLLDRLSDACSATILAIGKFVADQHVNWNTERRSNIPIGLLQLWAQGRWGYKGFSASWMVTSEALGNRRQLNIQCKSEARNHEINMHDAIHLAVQISNFRPGFERFAFNIDTGKGPGNGLFLDGTRLSKLLSENAPISKLGEVVETSMLWNQGTSLSRRIFSVNQVLKPSIETARRQFRSAVDSNIDKYVVREEENISTLDMRRWKLWVVASPEICVDQEKIEQLAHIIANRYRAKWLRAMDITGPVGIPLPPKQIIFEFRGRDQRIRNLKGGPYVVPRCGKILTVHL
jgi:hypothetical protein